MVYAQDPLSYNLNDENGLPSNEVYQVLQDDFGYMWIGCDAGLFRYDGFTYKQFKNEEQNGFSISDLKLDNKDRIWSRNFKGQIYCVSKNRLVIVTKGIKSNIAHALFTLDSKSTCWTIIDGTLYHIDAKGKILFSKKIRYQSKQIKIINSIALHNNNLYFSDQKNAIYCYSISKKTVRRIEKESFRTEINSFFIKGKDLFVKSEETGSNSISIFQILGSHCKPLNSFSLSKTNTRLYGIYPDKNNKSWLCTANGIAPYTPKMKSLDELSYIQKGKNVSSLLQDNEGNFWITTLQNGIFIIPNMNLIKYDISNSPLPENNLTALLKINKNEMLIGSYLGKVYLFNRKTRAFLEIKSNNPIKSTSVKFIYPYGNSYYISHGPLSVIKNGKISFSYPVPNTKGISIVKNKLHFVISEINGSALLSDLKDQSKFEFGERGGHDILYNPSDQTFYYGLNEGLFSFKNGKWKELKSHGKSIYTSEMILHNNQVCIASVSQGLFFISNSKIKSRIHSGNSKLENDLKCVTATKQFIWVCGINGLYRIDKRKSEIAQFSSFHGINTRDVNAIETNNGKVFLATNKGLIQFPENSNWVNRNPPAIKINRAKMDGKLININNTELFPFNNSQLTIELSSISFRSRGNYTYQYRIIGVDTLWTTVPAISNTIRFNTIPPGKYQFQVKAVNENGIPSEIKQFRFEVASPLWQKWWFYLFVSIVTVGLFGLVFYYRVKFIQRKADQLNKLTASQLTALKAQMNPHFMFNALNSIQELVLLNDTKSSNLYLGKFSHLMRKILDASDKEEISLQSEIEILNLYLELEKLRFKKDFVFTIDIDEKVDPYSIVIPSMILQPFVENALKHGLLHKKGEKELTIAFEIEKDTLLCTITDNGIGRDHAQEIKTRQNNSNASFATQATEKRIDLLNTYSKTNYTFEIIDLFENDKAKGTKVIITLPIA